MNKTSKTANFLKYLKTFILTALFVLISVLIIFGFINYQVYNEMTSKSVKEDTIDYYLVSVLIDKNKYLEENNPDDYRINLKLAILYEIQGDLKTSEAQYKIAISKAPFNEFKPEYRLASLYLIEDRLDDAQKVMDDIDERPDKKLISYKGEIYARIGDKYYNKGDYEEAGFKYQKSLYYFKVIDSKRIKDVEKSLVSSYVYLAEQNVRELNPVEAVKLLKMAMTIVDAPIIKYKLALLVMDTNPEQASAYFDEVFKREPNIINYEVYYNYSVSYTHLRRRRC